MLFNLKYLPLLNNWLLMDSRKREAIDIITWVETKDPVNSLILNSVNHKKRRECKKGPSKEEGKFIELEERRKQWHSERKPSELYFRTKLSKN